MHEDLYFLPLLAEALGRRDPHRALDEAIRQIRERGAQPRHRRGLRQFERFLAETAVARQEGAYDRIVATPSELERPAGLQFILRRDGTPIDTWSIESSSGVGVHTTGGIVPGAYQLWLDTGRLIWAKSLGPEQLLWTQAFPGMPLLAAADTDSSDRQATLAESVLEGTVSIRVYPGLEAGALAIERRMP